jgi:hypothetical protein
MQPAGDETRSIGGGDGGKDAAGPIVTMSVKQSKLEKDGDIHP